MSSKSIEGSSPSPPKYVTEDLGFCPYHKKEEKRVGLKGGEVGLLWYECGTISYFDNSQFNVMGSKIQEILKNGEQ